MEFLHSAKLVQKARLSELCTISLYKCSVITFITVKDQPVTSVERNLTNDSPEPQTSNQ